MAWAVNGTQTLNQNGVGDSQEFEMEAGSTGQDYTFSFTTTDAVSLIYGNRRYGVEIKAGHPAIDAVISDIEFYISKSGSPTGSAYFKVYNSSGTQQATTAALDVSTLGGIGWTRLQLTSTHTIAAGDRIVCEFSGGDSSNYVGVGENNNSGDQPVGAELVHYNISGGNAWGESTGAIILCKFGMRTILPPTTHIQALWHNATSGDATKQLVLNDVESSKYAIRKSNNFASDDSPVVNQSSIHTRYNQTDDQFGVVQILAKPGKETYIILDVANSNASAGTAPNTVNKAAKLQYSASAYSSALGQSTNDILSGQDFSSSSKAFGMKLVDTSHDGHSIKQATFSLKGVGSITGNAYCKVWSSSASGDITANVVATSEAVDVSTISTSAYEQVLFTFEDPVKLYNGYIVAVQYTDSSGGSSSKHLAFGEFHNGSSTIESGWNLVGFDKSNSNVWSDTGYPTLITPDAQVGIEIKKIALKNTSSGYIKSDANISVFGTD